MNCPETQKSSQLPELPKDVYLDERKININLELESTKTFDKAIITLSSGALGLSITFIRLIAPSPKYLWILFSAWGLLLFSLFTIMLSFKFSIRSLRRYRDMLDADQKGERDALKQKNTLARWTSFLNLFSLIAFILGIISLAVFVGTNLCRIRSEGG